MHFRARSYDPRTGRFLQLDPIKENVPTEHYVYAANDPANRVDPTGEYWVFPKDTPKQYLNVLLRMAERNFQADFFTKDGKAFSRRKTHKVPVYSKGRRPRVIGHKMSPMVPSFDSSTFDEFGSDDQPHDFVEFMESQWKKHGKGFADPRNGRRISFNDSMASSLFRELYKVGHSLLPTVAALEAASGTDLEGGQLSGFERGVRVVSLLPWTYIAGRALRGSPQLIRGLFGNINKLELDKALKSGNDTVRVVTNLSRPPQAGRGLSTAAGDSAEALARKARGGNQLYEAHIPREALDMLERAGLVERSTTRMGGVVGTEFRFNAGVTEHIVDMFKKID